MELRLTNKNKSDNRHVNREDYIQRGDTVYVDDNTDPQEPELTDEDSIDAPAEADEESDDDDGMPETEGTGSITPVWILYGDQIIWSASRYGFRIAPKEYFRRRIQALLDFLASRFPGKSYSELLISLQGFFANDNESSNGGWLDSLKNAGIIYFDESTREYKVMPVKNLRAGKGQGKNNEMPKRLEALLLEYELTRIKNASGNRPDWEKCRDILLDCFKKFCDEINNFCSTFETHEEVETQKGKKIYGIGLKKIAFSYEESTLDRKKLNSWKKRWAEI